MDGRIGYQISKVVNPECMLARDLSTVTKATSDVRIARPPAR